MRFANTKAALEYSTMNSSFTWTGASMEQEIVMLGKLENILRTNPPNEAIFVFGHNSESGAPEVETVSDVLNRVFLRKLNKSHLLLEKLGGKVASLRREVMRAELSMG